MPDSGESRRRSVVVTGMGAISALGLTSPAHSARVHDNWSGLRTITRFDATGFPTRFAAEVRDFAPEHAPGRDLALEHDRVTQLALVAAREAVTQAAIDIAAQPTRTAVLIGTALGGVESLTAATESMLTKGPASVPASTIPRWWPSQPSTAVARDLGATGTVFAPHSAFASSANAIGEGASMIREGRADVVIAGGSEAPITGPILAGFAAMHSLSSNNDHPQQAVKPFDLHRDGCALGEGAAILVLEEESSARTRGATILARVAGYGSTADAFHEVQIAPGAAGLIVAMNQAIEDASLPVDAIGYLNAHGTGTAMNDELETVAIKAVFGEAAYRLPTSATKSRTGHLLGAAGALEAVITIQAMQSGRLPWTLNFNVPDPACDLDYIAGESRQGTIEAAMSNSMGFGGHNVSLVFTRS